MLRKILLSIEPLRAITAVNPVQSYSLAVISKSRLFTENNQRRAYSTNSPVDDTNEGKNTVSIQPKKNLSKAMKAYLERAREHDEFMKNQKHEFEMGKRYLANMMGEDPETFTQEDIDNAIEYLFPSGLYEKQARPLMKPPEEVFPQRKAAEFDESGRPYHFLFYTGRANFYQLLYDCVEHLNELYKYEDDMLKRGLEADPNLTFSLSGYQWIDKDSLEKLLVEMITDREYGNFLTIMERLTQQPYSINKKEFIMQFCKPLMSHTETYESIKPQIDSDGVQVVTVYECRRKNATGTVTIRKPGTGKITINGTDLTYFDDIQCREQSVTTMDSNLMASSFHDTHHQHQQHHHHQQQYHQHPNKTVPAAVAVPTPIHQSVHQRTESYSLHNNNHYKPYGNSTISSRWQRAQFDPDIVLNDYDDEDFTSEEYEYMECGPSPPADHTPNIYESLEEFSTSELTVQICSDTIKNNLIEHMKLSSGKHHYLDDIESKKINADNVHVYFKNLNKIEINICFLWAAFVKHWELFDGLLKLGAQLNYSEPNQGLSALHLTAFSGCIDGTQYLIDHGSNVNAIYKCYSPLHCAAFGDNPETASILLTHGAQVQALTHSSSYNNESVLHCAVRANAIACVKRFISEGADVQQAQFSGMSPIHLACELGHSQCLKLMLEVNGVNVNAKTKEKEQSPLHLAAEGGYSECIDILLDKKADANLKNYRLQTPLHLAARAQSFDSVELLLRKGNANPNMTDCDKRTPLHAGVGKAARSYDIIEILLSYGADVNAKDQYGYTSLHIAALNELSQCVEVLIYHGADVTAKSKFGMTALGIITRKTPASLGMIKQKLDQAITLHHHPESSNREVELRLDFRSILQHCHPREISFLNTFVDEGHKEILSHPLCSAFLYLKWEKIRKYYIARMLFCFIFVLSLSLYVLTALAHNCYNHGNNINDTQPQNVIELCEKKSMMGHMLRNNPFVIEMQWFALVGITCCEILRKIYGLTGYPSVRQYLSHPENIIEWAVIISVFVISFVYTGRTYTWQNHVGAFAVLFGWTNLMLMVGQLPVFGPYVAMYTRVQGEFAKLLLAYSCLLIGFTISFCVIFPDSSTFANPFIGLITVLVMMTGELSLDLLVDDDPEDPPFLLEISAQVTYILFLLFVTVILMNLLVGIAVHDIQGLQKTAGLSKLVRQTKLISYIELALFNGYLPRYLLNLLHWTALVSPKAYRVVLNVKPLNPGEKRLPKDILEAAYEIAKKRKHFNRTISSYQNSCSKKTVLNNNSLDQQCNGTVDSSLPHSGPIALVHNKLDKSMEKIDALMKEVQELKSLLATMESSQKITQQILNNLVQRN